MRRVIHKNMKTCDQASIKETHKFAKKQQLSSQKEDTTELNE